MPCHLEHQVNLQLAKAFRWKPRKANSDKLTEDFQNLYLRQCFVLRRRDQGRRLYNSRYIDKLISYQELYRFLWRYARETYLSDQVVRKIFYTGLRGKHQDVPSPLLP